MVAKGGAKLIDEKAIYAIKKKMLKKNILNNTKYTRGRNSY